MKAIYLAVEFFLVVIFSFCQANYDYNITLQCTNGVMENGEEEDFVENENWTGQGSEKGLMERMGSKAHFTFFLFT